MNKEMVDQFAEEVINSSRLPTKCGKLIKALPAAVCGYVMQNFNKDISKTTANSLIDKAITRLSWDDNSVADRVISRCVVWSYDAIFTSIENLEATTQEEVYCAVIELYNTVKAVVDAEYIDHGCLIQIGNYIVDNDY